MITAVPSDRALTDEALIEAVADVLGRFLRATDALNRAIDAGNGIAMCDALERLGQARDRALQLVGR